MLQLLGSALTAGANAVGAGINVRNQRAINKQNLDFAQRQQTNQIAYQNAAVASQRQYDSPLEQRKRLQQAGVNPFTATDMLQSDVGISSDTPSAMSGNAAYTPVNLDFSSVMQCFQDLAKSNNDLELQANQHKHEKDMQTSSNTYDKNKQRAQFAHENLAREEDQEFKKDMIDLGQKYTLANMVLQQRDSLIRMWTQHNMTLEQMKQSNDFVAEQNRLDREQSQNQFTDRLDFDKYWKLIDLGRWKLDSNESKRRYNSRGNFDSFSITTPFGGSSWHYK